MIEWYTAGGAPVKRRRRCKAARTAKLAFLDHTKAKDAVRVSKNNALHTQKETGSAPSGTLPVTHGGVGKQ
ncbi:MAG: hypothetical protein Kow0077_13770 [Anaerolineae bacterium]